MQAFPCLTVEIPCLLDAFLVIPARQSLEGVHHPPDAVTHIRLHSQSRSESALGFKRLAPFTVQSGSLQPDPPLVLSPATVVHPCSSRALSEPTLFERISFLPRPSPPVTGPHPTLFPNIGSGCSLIFPNTAAASHLVLRVSFLANDSFLICLFQVLPVSSSVWTNLSLLPLPR